jgi:hypothetical protein
VCIQLWWRPADPGATRYGQQAVRGVRGGRGVWTMLRRGTRDVVKDNGICRNDLADQPVEVAAHFGVERLLTVSERMGDLPYR